MLYEDLTAKALEACFEVSKELGSGFLETVYERALLVALQEKGLAVKAQFPLSVQFRGHTVGEFYADILIEGKVIVELKAVRALTPDHYAQLINYLNATGIDVGLLVNFGNPKLQYKRFHRKRPQEGEMLKNLLS
jgi:GxxExxY protein